MAKAYSYIRFSSAKQSAGNSYDRQVKAAKEFCDQNGLELADAKEYLFFDAGRSAYKGRHLDDTGELARFLAYVEDGTIPAGSYLVVESLDRLSREKVRDALPRFLDLLAKGINVYTSADRRLYTKDYNELDLIVSIVSMSRAHEESATKGKRVSSAWRNKQQQARDSGKPIGKLRPLWLDVTDDGYALNTERVEVVRRIFKLSTDGHGSRTIAATLNQEGIPSFTAGRKNLSGLWGHSTITHILDTRSVLGEYQPHIFVDGKRTPDGDPITSYFPAVISEDDFYRAQAAREGRREGKSTKRPKNFNLFAGVLHCYQCEAPMHLQGVRDRKYYKCFNSHRGLCSAGIISAPRAEEVFREILAKVDSLSLVQSSSGNITKQLQITEGRIAELKGRQSEAEEAHAEYPSRITAKLLSELESNIEDLEQERDRLTVQLAADKVVSKEDFFQKLDLVSFEGRAAANNLLRRLDVHTYAIKHGRTYETYYVSDAKLKPHASNADHLITIIDHIGPETHSETKRTNVAELEYVQMANSQLKGVQELLTVIDDIPDDEIPSEVRAEIKAQLRKPE